MYSAVINYSTDQLINQLVVNRSRYKGYTTSDAIRASLSSSVELSTGTTASKAWNEGHLAGHLYLQMDRTPHSGHVNVFFDGSHFVALVSSDSYKVMSKGFCVMKLLAVVRRVVWVESVYHHTDMIILGVLQDQEIF